jgi:iron complex outermembrane receptor protein
MIKKLFIVLILSGVLYPLFSQQQDTTIIFEEDTIDVVENKYLLLPNSGNVGSKINIPIHKTPASIGVVTSDLMQEQNAMVLSDALKNISSINVQSNLGTNDYFLIRGFESSTSGLILTDGIHSPDISMYEIYGFGFYDMYNVERVEVLKGPGSFLYGAITLSGAVNLVRKKPIPKNFVTTNLRLGEYHLQRGKFDAGFANANQNVMVRFNGLLQYTEQFRKGKYSKSNALNPALTWQVNKQEILNLNFEYLSNEIIPDAGIPIYNDDRKWRLPDIPLNMSFQTPLDISKQEIVKVYLEYENKINHLLKAESKFYYKHLTGATDLTVPHTPYSNFSGAWVVERHLYSFNEQQTILGNQNEATFKYEYSEFKNELLVGFETSLLRGNSKTALSILPSTLLFQHKEQVKNSNDIFRLNDIHCNTKLFSLAPYFVNYMHLLESYQFLMGGRYDILHFETDRQVAPFDYFTMSLSSIPEPLTKKFSKFSPMAGFIYQESEHVWFYANAGKSFSRGRRIIDEPIISTQFEIGYKYRTKDGKIRNSFALYNLQKDHIAIPLQGPLQGFAHSPTGSQRSQGLEFEFSAFPLEDWFFAFTYSFTNADLLKYKALYIDENFKTGLQDFTDNSPAFIPAHLLNIWTTKKIYRGLGIGAGTRYVGKQYAYVDNAFEIKGYFLLDLSLFYLSEPLEVRLNIKNITGETYLTRGFGPYSVIPAGGAQISGGINFIL